MSKPSPENCRYRVLLTLLTAGRGAGGELTENRLLRRATTTRYQRPELEKAVAGLVDDGWVQQPKPGRVALTPAGAAGLLDPGPPSRFRLVGSQARALIQLCRTRLAGPGEPEGPLHHPDTYDAFREAVLDILNQHAGGNSGMVPLPVFRSTIVYPRNAFDKGLFRMQREKAICLDKINDAYGIPPEELRQGVRSPRRGLLFYVSRGERG